MKKLSLYLLLMALALTLALAGEAWFPGTEKRVWHHEAAADAAYCETPAEGTFCSHLPLVCIDTEGNAPSLSSPVPAELRVIHHPEGHNHLEDSPTLAGEIQIQIQKGPTARYGKKPYHLTFPEAPGQALPDMPAATGWELTGPFLDKTLLRDYLMYNLAGEIMGSSPNVRFCEVFLNGGYRGIYLLTESPAAVASLSAPDPNSPGTDYLLAWNGSGTALNTFGLYSGMYRTPLTVVYPDAAAGVTETHLEYIRQDVGALEAYLSSSEFSLPLSGYTSPIDTASFVDYFILNELAMNTDAAEGSGYAYKPQGGRLTIGPVWSFETACNNYPDYAFPTDSFSLTNSPWYRSLLRDRRFAEQILQRYAQLRRGPLSPERIEEKIEKAAAFLAPALQREDALWGYEAPPMENIAYSDFSPLSYDRNPGSYEEALTQLKAFLRRRGAFLDQHLDLIKQFSAPAQ